MVRGNTTVRREFRLRRWYIAIGLTVFRSRHGLADFHFVFKLGFPRHSPKTVREIEAMLHE